MFDRGNIILKSNISPAGPGNVQFRMTDNARNFKLSSSVNAFQAAIDPYRDNTKVHHWDAKHPAPVLLLQLSGHFGRDAFTVVDPSTVHVK